jgi:hypothetical protein
VNSNHTLTAIKDHLAEVRDSLGAAHPSIPASEIIDRARRRRVRRRLIPGLAVTLALAAGAAVAVTALGAPGAASNGRTGTIRTAAFVLTRNANGTDTLTLSKSQVLDPAALQQALARDGVRALIKINADCTSKPAPPPPTSIGVVSFELPDGTPLPVPTTHEPGTRLPADVVIVFKPSAIPAGTEMFVGYRTFGTLAVPVRVRAYQLIYTSSYTCSNRFPAGGPEGS